MYQPPIKLLNINTTAEYSNNHHLQMLQLNISVSNYKNPQPLKISRSIPMIEIMNNNNMDFMFEEIINSMKFHLVEELKKIRDDI